MNTPECDKMLKVSEDSQKIGEFLDWLDEKGIRLARHHEHTDDCYEPHVHENDPLCPWAKGSCRVERDRICGWGDDALAPIHVSIEKLLADYFEIDLDKVETERRAMLEGLRAAGRKQPPGVPR